MTAPKIGHVYAELSRATDQIGTAIKLLEKAALSLKALEGSDRRLARQADALMAIVTGDDGLEAVEQELTRIEGTMEMQIDEQSTERASYLAR